MNHSPTEGAQGSANSMTPRTEARCVEMAGIAGRLVSADFARTLERQLAEANEEVERLQDLHVINGTHKANLNEVIDDLRRQLAQSEERVKELEGDAALLDFMEGHPAFCIFQLDNGFVSAALPSGVTGSGLSLREALINLAEDHHHYETEKQCKKEM